MQLPFPDVLLEFPEENAVLHPPFQRCCTSDVQLPLQSNDASATMGTAEEN